MPYYQIRAPISGCRWQRAPRGAEGDDPPCDMHSSWRRTKTERLKVLGVWSMFPRRGPPGSSACHGHAWPQRARADGAPVRQRGPVVSDDAGQSGPAWPRLPEIERRLDFHPTLCREFPPSGWDALRSRPESWWEGETRFFDTIPGRGRGSSSGASRTRPHHRGQQMAMLRMLKPRPAQQTTGRPPIRVGLPQNHAPVVYAYPDLAALLAGRARGRTQGDASRPGRTARLPSGPGS